MKTIHDGCVISDFPLTDTVADDETLQLADASGTCVVLTRDDVNLIVEQTVGRMLMQFGSATYHAGGVDLKVALVKKLAELASLDND